MVRELPGEQSEDQGGVPRAAPPPPRPRLRDHGVVVGHLPTGPLNAITDVMGVRVGHVTLFAGTGPLREGHGPVRTGVTAVLPHGRNLFREKVVGAVHTINAFGKIVGTTQVAELGVIETPIILTNTLSIGSAVEGLIEHALRSNPEIGVTTGSVNPVVGECNDGALNDMRGRHVKPWHVLEAVAQATEGPVSEGVVGAGTGMSCYGWKGGIGTASREAEVRGTRYTVGTLVLANFGSSRDLVIANVPIGGHVRQPANGGAHSFGPGSCVVVVGTDAPASARQLGRIARRVQSGIARTGTYGEHGSGEYAVAFSTANAVPHFSTAATVASTELTEDGAVMDVLFEATVEATEEAILNALFVADTVRGVDDHVRFGLPIDLVVALLRSPASEA